MTSRLDHIGSYGSVHGFHDKWYVWPGLCFHSRVLLQGHQVNFMPVLYLDTGGGNYAQIYSKQTRDHFEMPDLERHPEKFYERFGPWIHIIRASGVWVEKPENFDEMIEELMQTY